MADCAATRIAVFIDGPSLRAAAKSLGFDIDYRNILTEFESRGTILRAFYYTTIVEDEEYSSIRPLIDWLGYNGYAVVTKAAKETIDFKGQRRVNANTNVELCVDALELAGHIDRMVLFSGDGDFRCLVEAMQRRGVRVTVISTTACHPAMIADELRRQADVFADLAELRPMIERRASTRSAPREIRNGRKIMPVRPNGPQEESDPG